MSFSNLYRISFYAMLTIATLTLNVDARSDYPLAPLYPVVMAAACVLAFLTVDRNPALGLPPDLGKLLAVGTIALSVFEYWVYPDLLVLVMGHWLVYLQLVKVLMPKTVEDDWFLYLLALTQVVVGAFLPGDSVGTVLVIWAVVALWTLGLFYLQREAVDSQTPRQDIKVTPVPDPREPYPGLIDLPFILSGLKVALITLALGGLIFLLMPRWGLATQPRNQSPALAQNLTGFTDTVQLGQMGQILESEEVVMSIELYDEEDRRVAPNGEALWRGVVMASYEDGRWKQQLPEQPDLRSAMAPVALPQRFLRQEIKLEPTSSEVLFAMRPILRAVGPSLQFNRTNGTLLRGDLRGPRSLRGVRSRLGQYDYTVISGIDSNEAPQPGERHPSNSEIIGELLVVPDDEVLRGVLAEIVDRVVKDIPAEDLVSRAEALERYLRDSGEFAYSLDMTVQDRSIDPIADFLRNRKEGHCEYYASALTMLLRSAGIPARMINGFKGGDYNDLGKVVVVRQKHAHSWVEALVGRTQRADGIVSTWKTLDPTPALERRESVSRVGGFTRFFRFFSDYIRYLWVFYVIGFNEQRQETLIYGPIRALVEQARDGFRVMATWLRDLRALLTFPDLRSFFSVRGFVVSFVALLMFTLIARVIRFLIRRMTLRRLRAAEISAELNSGVASYRRLIRLMGELGLHRPPAETPREFARRAADVLISRGLETSQLAAVPSHVVDAFYGVRYGDRPLVPRAIEGLERELDRLESCLRPARESRA